MEDGIEQYTSILLELEMERLSESRKKAHASGTQK